MIEVRLGDPKTKRKGPGPSARELFVQMLREAPEGKMSYAEAEAKFKTLGHTSPMWSALSQAKRDGQVVKTGRMGGGTLALKPHSGTSTSITTYRKPGLALGRQRKPQQQVRPQTALTTPLALPISEHLIDADPVTALMLSAVQTGRIMERAKAATSGGRTEDAVGGVLLTRLASLVGGGR